MQIRLTENAYGKNAINLSKIIRHQDSHEFRQISVSIVLRGDFESAHTEGDNTKILPTDTQKNTVYALAKYHFTSSIEAFGIVLADHFIKNNPQLASAEVQIIEHLYSRLVFNGNAHPHSFISRGNEKHIACIHKDATGTRVSSGIKDLLILKTTDSGFEHFIRDQFTTLKPTNDRIMATQCEAVWSYTKLPDDYALAYESIREHLLHSFAFHNSLSVQHTLYAMGKQLLEDHDEVKDISLIMPNKHHILFNLEQFDMENKNEVFIATDEPFGYITGTVSRED